MSKNHQNPSLISTAMVVLLCINVNALWSQRWCFYDPNTGPLYNNGSSGAIYDVTHGDFNEDNHMDIVTANSTAANISFVPGLGDGTLGAADTQSVPDIAFSITSGYFNSDTHRDIAVGGGTAISILTGMGDGTFQLVHQYSTSRADRLYSMDVNNDSIADLLTAGGSAIHVLLGAGDGTFSNNTYNITGEPHDLTVADMDGDSIADIVVTVRITLTTAAIAFMAGHGDGTFDSPIYYPTPHYNLFGIRATDIDSDDKMDLIVANTSIGRLEVYPGNGDGTFDSPLFYDAVFDPTYLHLANVDATPGPEIITVENGGFSVYPIGLTGMIGQGQRIQSAPAPNSLAIADFNEDGKLDVVVPSAYFGSGTIGMNINCNFPSSTDNFKPVTSRALTIFPNPASQDIAWLPDELVSITIYDIDSKFIYEVAELNGSDHLDVAHLPAGHYILKATGKNRDTYSGQFVKLD